MSSSFRRAGQRPVQQQPSAAAAAAARPVDVGAEPNQLPTGTPEARKVDVDDDGAPPNPTTSSQEKLRLRPAVTATTHNLRLPGVKPWTGGLTLTSSGLREIDAILGGGQPLGTSVLVEEDRWTFDLGLCLARYWAAEAVTQGQILVLPATRPEDPSSLPTSPLSPLDDDDDDDEQSRDNNDLDNDVGGSSSSDLRTFVQSLPRDLHLDKYRSKANKDAAEANSSKGEVESAQDVGGTDVAREVGSAPFAIIEEEEFEEEEEEKDHHHHHHDNDGAAAGRSRREDGNAADAAEAEEGLKIAWQYRTSVQRERLGHGPSSGRGGRQPKDGKPSTATGEVYCHSYDLSGRLLDQHVPGWAEEDDGHPSSLGIHVADCSCPCCPNCGACRQTRRCGFGLFQSVLREVKRHLSDQEGGVNNQVVVRILLLDAPIMATSVALPLLLAYVRANSLPVAVMVTVRPWRCIKTMASALTALRRASDVVLSTEGFASLRDPPPSEFRDLAGILTTRKMASMGGAHFADAPIGRRPPADRYGMKRDRRKVHVRLLHLPPEEESAGGSSTSGVRSGGGIPRTTTTPAPTTAPTTALEPGSGCGSGRRGGGSNTLDF